MKKTTKSTLLECQAKVVNIDSSCVGAMSFETPYVTFQTAYGRYRWQSNDVDIKARWLREGMMVYLKAYVREGTRHLFRVQVKPAPGSYPKPTAEPGRQFSRLDGK